jgi:hypothetical protein
MKRPWDYISRDMNLPGAMVGLGVLGLLIADLAIIGSTPVGYVGAAVIVLVSAAALRTTAHRRGRCDNQ